MTSMRREEPAWPPPPVRSWSLAFRPSVTACMRIFIPLEGVGKLTCKLIALHILPLWAHSYFGLGAPELITQHSSLSESEISPNQNTFSKNLKRLQILHWKWIQHFYLKTLQNILWDGFWHPNRYSLGPKLIKIVTFFTKSRQILHWKWTQLFYLKTLKEHPMRNWLLHWAGNTASNILTDIPWD